MNQMTILLLIELLCTLFTTIGGYGQGITLVGNDITKCEPSWQPEFGNTTTFTAKIYRRDPISGACFTGPPGIIHFVIFSSNERGYCLNKGTKLHTDLHFNTPENIGTFVPVDVIVDACDLVGGIHEHWTHVRTFGCTQEATVTVKSEDFGGFGGICAWTEFPPECPLPPDVMVVTFQPREPGGVTSCDTGMACTSIPRDDNGNNIADNWWGDNLNGTDPTYDAEEIPNPDASEKGDGLTRYEEYRGAFVNGNHERFLVLTKELFVYRDNPAYGAETAESAAEVYYIQANEMNGLTPDPDMDSNPPAAGGSVNPNRGPHVINCNGGFAHKVDQHGLWLHVGGLDQPASWGVAHGGPIGSPKSARRINIFSAQVADDCQNRIGRAFPYIYKGAYKCWNSRGRFSQQAATRTEELIKATIGHELGHRINLHHHGSKNVAVNHIPADAPTPFTVNPPPQTFNGPMTSASGDRSCVMRYEFPEILLSKALVRNRDVGRKPPSYWTSRAPDWSLLPIAATSYCTNADNGFPGACRKTIQIDDANNGLIATPSIDTPYKEISLWNVQK